MANPLNLGSILVRFLRAAITGFFAGAALGVQNSLSSGGAINARNVLVGGALVGGITGTIMAVGKAVRDATGNELTP